MDLTKGNGDHSFVPIAAKWLASRTDDDDDDDENNVQYIIIILLLNCHL